VLKRPRDGHLTAVFILRDYLNTKKYNARTAFDPTYPVIDMPSFNLCDWEQYYGNMKEAIPPNAPEPQGKEVDLRLFVDCDHAGARSGNTRNSVITYMNL
jgi:hypothetical protein